MSDKVDDEIVRAPLEERLYEFLASRYRQTVDKEGDLCMKEKTRVLATQIAEFIIDEAVSLGAEVES